jgi:glycerol-3-phosphate dehydrogenase
MAEETIDRAITAGFLDRKICVTRDLKMNTLADTESQDRLNIYGKYSSEIKMMIHNNPASGAPIHPRFPYTSAELIWICRNEMPVTLADILARRTRALLMDARASIDIAAEVATIIANEIGYDKYWQEQQVADYKKIAANYM